MNTGAKGGDHGFLADPLRPLPVDWKPQERMANYTSLLVGGPADMIVVRELEALPEVVGVLARHGVPWRLLGGGTNLLVADEGLSSVVVRLAPERDGVKIEGGLAEISATASLGQSVTYCAKRNLGGVEGLVGVPGTVGGALRMNAGAYGTEIGDYIQSVRVFRGSTGNIETILPGSYESGEIRFEYRHSSFAPDDVMLSVTLELAERPFAEIVEKIKQCNRKRRSSQPINQKSAGCIFKNAPGLSTGKLIDEQGMKGREVGGAMISDRHANFIVNRGGAKAADIFRLMDMIREKLLKAYQVELEEEVIVWRDPV
ncbi:MAG: UDP-N-acetylmuramate dehydrogenase [Acidobacteria bacterium]|nr:UDP-N-acetylmuramate dehydrogenase [Acidobacteriota bacterium]